MVHIRKVVSDDSGIPVSLIMSDSRKREVVEQRHLIAYFAKEYTSSSLERIGEYFGGDHCRALHSIRVVNNLIETDKDFENKVKRIRTKL